VRFGWRFKPLMTRQEPSEGRGTGGDEEGIGLIVTPPKRPDNGGDSAGGVGERGRGA